MIAALARGFCFHGIYGVAICYVDILRCSNNFVIEVEGWQNFFGGKAVRKPPPPDNTCTRCAFWRAPKRDVPMKEEDGRR